MERISLGAWQLPQGEKMPTFASLLDTVVTRAPGSRDPTETILEEAQHKIESKDIRFR